MRFDPNVLISPEALHSALESDPSSLVILDGTFRLPNDPVDAADGYEAQRIAGAGFFDIRAAVNKDTDIPNMLPSEAAFANYVSGLGVGNDSHVVVYGQTGMGMGPARVWWMFRVFGHERVQVLDGGLPAWLAAGHGVEEGAGSLPQRSSSAFVARLCSEHVVCMDEMRDISSNRSCTILDARGKERFDGTYPEPREGIRAGHIPSSKNIPYSSLIDEKTHKMKGREVLKAALLEEHFIESGEPVVTTCGSGVTACLLALALSHIEHDSVRVYDGSWSEWGLESLGAPIEIS